MFMSIDPGTEQSAYVLFGQDYKPVKFDRAPNESVLDNIGIVRPDVLILERVASYGMPVGQEVFRTCEWIGRFAQKAIERRVIVDYVLRQEEKLSICHDPRANDASIRRALIDRFARHDLKRGTGTKNNPDFFYGFRRDIWQAFAVGVTWLDKAKEE